MTLITALMTSAVALVCAFPYLNLAEGSFLHAVLSPLHGFLDSYVNVFASGILRPYGLIPLGVFCLLNLFLALRGSGILQFLLRCVAFYSLYLLGAYFQGEGAAFPVLRTLPELYPVFAGGLLSVSSILLALIYKIKHGIGDGGSAKAAVAPDGEADSGETGPVSFVGLEPDVKDGAADAPVAEERTYVRDPQQYKLTCLWEDWFINYKCVIVCYFFIISLLSIYSYVTHCSIFIFWNSY